MNERQILTPAQAAALLGLSKTTAVEWCQRGILPAIRVDSRWYLKRPELVRWLEGQDSAKEMNGDRTNPGHDDRPRGNAADPRESTGDPSDQTRSTRETPRCEL